MSVQAGNLCTVGFCLSGVNGRPNGGESVTGGRISCSPISSYKSDVSSLASSKITRVVLLTFGSVYWHLALSFINI